MKTYIGVDVGGTKMLAVRYDAEMNELARARVLTESSQGREHVLANLMAVTQQVQTDDTVAVGVAWAGFVNAEMGTVMHSPNIPDMDEFSLTDSITAKTGLPARLENDARLFAYAEAMVRPEAKNVLGIILGTGVGSGIILNGNVYRGSGAAGEVGHILVNGTEAEALFAGPGLAAWANELGWGSDLKVIQQKMEQDTSPYAEEMIKKIDQMAQWLAGLCLTLAPDVVVFGGGVGTHFWVLWRAEIERATNAYLKGYPVTLRLCISKIENAGVVGAGYLAQICVK